MSGEKVKYNRDTYTWKEKGRLQKKKLVEVYRGEILKKGGDELKANLESLNSMMLKYFLGKKTGHVVKSFEFKIPGGRILQYRVRALRDKPRAPRYHNVRGAVSVYIMDSNGTLIARGAKFQWTLFEGKGAPYRIIKKRNAASVNYIYSDGEKLKHTVKGRHAENFWMSLKTMIHFVSREARKEFQAKKRKGLDSPLF